MDINLIRSVVTVVSLLLFVALIVWAWGRGRRQGFDEAAMLPFADDSGAHQGRSDPTRRAS